MVGILAVHLASCLTVALQGVFGAVYAYTHERSVFTFVGATVSSSARHSEFVLNNVSLAVSVVAVLCVLDMMKSLFD